MDVLESLDGGYDRYDCVDFIRWEQGALVVEAGEIIAENGKLTLAPRKLAIAEKAYRAWLHA